MDMKVKSLALLTAILSSLSVLYVAAYGIQIFDVDYIHACLEAVGPDSDKLFGPYDGDGITAIKVTITATKDGGENVNYWVGVKITRNNEYGETLYDGHLKPGQSTGYIGTDGDDACVILYWVDNGAYQYDAYATVYFIDWTGGS